MYVICTSHQAYDASHRARKTWQTLWWPIVDPESICAPTPWLPSSLIIKFCWLSLHWCHSSLHHLGWGCKVENWMQHWQSRPRTVGHTPRIGPCSRVRDFSCDASSPCRPHHPQRQAQPTPWWLTKNSTNNLKIKAWSKVVRLTNKCRILCTPFCYDCEASWRYEWVWVLGAQFYSSFCTVL